MQNFIEMEQQLRVHIIYMNMRNSIHMNAIENISLGQLSAYNSQNSL